MFIFKKIIATILQWEARLVLRRYRPHIIAVTGSVGKTTTKDAIYAALATRVHVRKSEKSLNSDIGVPLAILGLENAWRNVFGWIFNIVRGLLLAFDGSKYPDWLVLEVGADRPGDIRSIARWLKPEIAVITGVPDIPVHVEYFNSPGDVVREKRALAEYLRPGGSVVVNGDDVRMLRIAADFKERAVTYGLEGTNMYAASHMDIITDGGKPIGMQFDPMCDHTSRTVQTHGALGAPRVYAALAAIAVGKIVGVDIDSAVAALEKWAPPQGRMRLIEGLRGTIILDDTYNSSPTAALSALDTLKDIKTKKRKIAVLGDMMELGKYSAEAHKQLGVRAAAVADQLITVGFRARQAAQAALDAGMQDSAIRQYEQFESARAGKELESELQKGDIVLVKGSQSMRMERTVEEIMADPIHATELLVRQDQEWKDR